MVILAVGLDSSTFETPTLVWQSAECIVRSVGSVRDAIAQFKDGDFDIVLLGHTIPADSRERLTFLIRKSGSRVPVVCISNSSSECDSFADATINNEPINILETIGGLIAHRAKMPAASVVTARPTT
jgi:DNA-binding response OmpR family regulator